MHYDDLDPKAQYKMRVVYYGDGLSKKIRCVADETSKSIRSLPRSVPPGPVEFDIPPDATRDGQLNLSWYREPNLGDNGRGCQVSEIWLIKK